jgi:splicing factor 3A subunit 3
VWEKLKSSTKAESFKADTMEEFEDAEGNVFNKKTFEGMSDDDLYILQYIELTIGNIQI